MNYVPHLRYMKLYAKKDGKQFLTKFEAHIQKAKKDIAI